MQTMRSSNGLENEVSPSDIFRLWLSGASGKIKNSFREKNFEGV